jgi:hypothetical protein
MIYFILGTKASNDNHGDCIITVLDANDLPPFNSNTSSTVTPGNTTIQSNSPSSISISRNRRHQNNNSRSFLRRFFLFHGSN